MKATSPMTRFVDRIFGKEDGMTTMEFLGIVLGILLLTGLGAFALKNVFDKMRLSEMEQNLITLRLQTQHLFMGSNDYDGLDNTLAINSGIVPKGFIKGSVLVNPWKGAITLAPDDGNAAFSIQVDDIPRSECVLLARFQQDEWVSVTVNGSETGSVAEAADACSSDANTIIYIAR
jgi:type II secretory pathway pseudopilin PulG